MKEASISKAGKTSAGLRKERASFNLGNGTKFLRVKRIRKQEDPKEEDLSNCHWGLGTAENRWDKNEAGMRLSFVDLRDIYLLVQSIPSISSKL